MMICAGCGAVLTATANRVVVAVMNGHSWSGDLDATVCPHCCHALPALPVPGIPFVARGHGMSDDLPYTTDEAPRTIDPSTIKPFR